MVIRRKNLIFEELAEKQAKLETLSNRDTLTGLLNRRAFLEKSRCEESRARRHSIRHGLIMGDIERFKEINDSHGHGFGDLVLRSVAKIFQQNLRVQDSICRWGGEEFVVLLPDSDEASAAAVAEKLRLAVAHHSFQREGLSIRCTISFGVAEINETISLEESIQVADGNL